MSKDFSSLIGLEMKGSSFKIKKDKLVDFAKSIGVKQEQFLNDDPIAHPAYANAYVFPALWKVNDVKGPDGQPIIKNPLKILHGGQGYKFPKGSPALKDGDKIKTTPKLKNIEVKSNGMLAIDIEAISIVEDSNDKSKVGKTVCISDIGVLVMSGGY